MKKIIEGISKRDHFVYQLSVLLTISIIFHNEVQIKFMQQIKKCTENKMKD